ncbi:16S rRNA (cytosine(1402)-N(4))-methyltransferase RsmH [Solitalea canadensis]|uniref:Ribosomal RNA small subunit methyltransferase H n=1 Tax=Solitalea canadensis (strain ATCC 29591 / DSM 3403 / JCM 21819 / LMG 8368 / NBRC 15130 / NCIMB 12057 / USAM 9D) TaxID=929556 RepID=H8KRY9_SOLCM|nr:S-adenosyl-methyltransferase MraW [Solitalea canadensis DSM 3403]
MSYHNPVMLKECLDGLNIDPNGVYVDVTFGGGGHSKAILERLDKGTLISFDQDPDAAKNAPEDDRLIFVAQNFRYLKKFCKLNGFKQVDGILADLGVSSHQFDSAKRGFSIRFDAELDMRMDQTSDLTAKKVINEYDEAELHRIFGMYGEIHNSKTLAKTIVVARLRESINTIAQLKEIVKPLVKRGKENQYYAQLFQAVRIEVNQELEALQEMLEQSAEILKPGGRLVVMSYHSLEDRLVKNFINKGKFRGEVEKDFFGNEIKPFEQLTRKAIVPTEEEIKENNRARSAKLRIGVKL